MSRTASRVRRPSRGVVQVTALAVVLAGTGVAVAGTTPAASQQVVRPQLTYACTYPASVRAAIVDVGVRIGATFPATGTVGQPIRPSKMGLRITVPHSEVSNLSQLHADTVAAGARLSIKVAENGTSANESWAGVSTRPAPLPAQGSLVLSAAGTASAVAARSAGNVTFTAANLVLHITPGTGTTATNSPVVQLSCQLQPGQDATLATVPVTAGISTLPRQGRPGHKLAKTAAKPPCPPFPKNGYKFNPHFPLPGYPPGSTVTFPKPEFQGCAYIKGFSNVRKLHGAALVGPGLTSVNLTRRVVINLKRKYAQLDNTGRLFYRPCATCKPENALPPATNTLLGFGFVPTTVTLQVFELGTLNIASVGSSTGPLKYSRVSSRATIRILRVKVNGVPLNVGNNCRTKTPFDLVVTGKPPYQLQTGGVLTGTVTVPPFTGCGAYENLDPIFNAAVSGPGNFVKLTQGNLCTPKPTPIGCPPTIPKPVH